MSDFFEDDVIGTLHDACNAYISCARRNADRYRLQGEVCDVCGTDIEDDLEEGLRAVIDGDAWSWHEVY